METPGIEVKYPRTDQAFGMAYHNISPTHGEGWEDFSASIEGEMQKLEVELSKHKRDLDLLSELKLSASELLYSAFLYHLNSNPISTEPFIESLRNASDWIEEPQKQAIKDLIKSACSSDYLTNDQYIQWECVLTNLS